jgi:hypothetical protein
VMDRVFATFIITKQDILYLDLHVRLVPVDFDEKQCYLCNGIINHNYLDSIMYNTTFKKINAQLYACAHCVYQNHHDLLQWHEYVLPFILPS